MVARGQVGQVGGVFSEWVRDSADDAVEAMEDVVALWL